MAKNKKQKVKKEVKQRIGKGENPDAEMVAVREVNADTVVSISEYKQKSRSLRSAQLDDATTTGEGGAVVDFRQKMPAGLRGAVMYVSHKLRREGRTQDADIVEYRYGISEYSEYKPHTTAATATKFSVEQKQVILLDREVSKLYKPPTANASTADDMTTVLAHMHHMQNNNPQKASLLYQKAINDTVEDLKGEGKNKEAEAILYRHPHAGLSTETTASIHETASKFSFTVKEMLAVEKLVGRKLLENLLRDEQEGYGQ